jgi:hypothetical protein
MITNGVVALSFSLMSPNGDLFASEQEALQSSDRLDKLLNRLGLMRHPTKGFKEPTEYGHHMGININPTMGYFSTPADKLTKISSHIRHFI